MTENLSNNNVRNKKSSLLDSFLLEMMKQYDEPQRKGTPRGEAIGFSWQKHCASLLMLKKYSLKYIAETLKVSYGLIRKWRTEDQFIKQIDENETEYITHLVNHLNQRGAKQVELADHYFEKPVTEMIKTPPPELSMNEFLDLKLYNPRLIISIAVVLIEHGNSIYKKIDFDSKGFSLEERVALAIYFQYQHFLNIISSYPFKKVDTEKVEKMRAEEEELNNFYLEKSLRVMGHDLKSEGRVTEDSLKHIIYTLYYASKNFSLVDMDY